MYIIEQSTTRYIQNSNYRCVQHPRKRNIMIDTSNVVERKELPFWKLKLYQLASALLKMVNKTWAGKIMIIIVSNFLHG